MSKTAVHDQKQRYKTKTAQAEKFDTAQLHFLHKKCKSAKMQVTNFLGQ